jgi:ferredoxin
VEDFEMAYVIVEPCITVKDAACVNVCPVDCIHPKKDEGEFEKVDQLFIDPDTCIDCGACVPECPVSAIFPEPDVADNMKSYIAKNSAYFKK